MTYIECIGILDIIVVRSSMQVEDIIEDTNDKYLMFTFQSARGRYS